MWLVYHVVPLLCIYHLAELCVLLGIASDREDSKSKSSKDSSISADKILQVQVTGNQMKPKLLLLLMYWPKIPLIMTCHGIKYHETFICETRTKPFSLMPLSEISYKL